LRSSSSVVGPFFIGRSPRPSLAIDRLTTLYFSFHAPSPEGHKRAEKVDPAGALLASREAEAAEDPE